MVYRRVEVKPDGLEGRHVRRIDHSGMSGSHETLRTAVVEIL